MSPRSTKSCASTVRTVDDVFSQLDVDLGENASLAESRDRIRKLTKNNNILEYKSIDQLQSIRAVLAPVCVNVDSLIKSMFRYKVALGGIQATSFFYPLCTFSQSPWDFFCSNKNDMGDKFVTDLIQFSGLDLIEDLKSDTKERVVYFRGTVNGTDEPINVRVYISDTDPMQSVLNYEMSYQQTFVSPVAAVCFWPRLNRKSYYRVFKSNSSQREYPTGKTVVTVNMRKMSRTTVKNPQSTPSIYTGVLDRVEVVVFKNELKLDKNVFNKQASKIQSIVYAVSEHSTKYLGDTSGM
jgi:hypothetical protein